VCFFFCCERNSVAVQLIAWKDLSPEWDVNSAHSHTHFAFRLTEEVIFPDHFSSEA